MLLKRAYGREVKAAGCKPVGVHPSVGANPTVPKIMGFYASTKTTKFPKKGSLSLVNLVKRTF